jgi:hypothetical protein
MADYNINTNLSGAVNSDVTADVTSTLAGLDAMNLTLAGGTTTTLAGENTVNTDSKVAFAPVTTTSSVDTTSKFDSASVIDLRPVALDSCVRLELAPPPATEVCTPYEQQWSWSVLGLELFAVTVRGSTSTHVRPARTDPVVIEL